MSIVKTLRPELVECGKIKIGGKGAEKTSKMGNKFNAPEKYDGFVITKLNKSTQNFDIDYEAMYKFGGYNTETKQITPLKKLPVSFPFDNHEMIFSTRMACYKGKTCVCSGDGETATNLITGEVIPCSCEKSKPDYTGKDKCKINGKLSLQLGKGVTPVGKVHVFRTTGWHSCNAILSSIFAIMAETGYRLRGAKFHLVYDTKSIIDSSGASRTIPVVSVEYNGTREDLRKAIAKNAETEAQFLGTMKKLEGLAIAFKEDPILGLDDIPEFYPESQGLPEPEIEEPTTVEEPVFIDDEIEEPTPTTQKQKAPTVDELRDKLIAFGWTEEQLEGIKKPQLRSMLENGETPPVEVHEEIEIEEPEIEDNDDVDFGDC